MPRLPLLNAFLFALTLLTLAACSKDEPKASTQGAQTTPGASEEEKKDPIVGQGGRQLKVIQLPNQLEVILISDPKASKSSAALNVAVGSMSNPAEWRGMAHYLEHMLFLGTAKYPKPGDFDQFLGKNAGGSNAYTSETDTNYYFDVGHSAFEGALDQFSQFFIAPLFNDKFIAPEMKNVDAEYQKNRRNTVRRWLYLYRILADEGAPTRNGFQGSQETLGNVPRQALLDFFHRYYSANQMKLALITPLSLEKMEELVRAKFAAVPNTNAATVTAPTTVISDSRLPHQIEFRTADNERLLALTFYVPSALKHWDTKPIDLINRALNFSGPGSLVSALKAQGLVTSVQAGDQTFGHSTQLYIMASLTAKGAAQYKDVTKAIFAWIKQIEAQNVLSEQVYADAAQVAKLNYTYGSPSRGGDGAANYTRWMRELGSDNVEAKAYLYSRYDRELLRSYLALLTPERMSLSLATPEITGGQKADFYDIEYNLKDLRKDPWIAELKSLPAGSYQTLGKNPFVPTDMSLADTNGQQARRVVTNDYGSLWLAPSAFGQPKTKVRVRLVDADAQINTRNAALAQMYLQAQKKKLEEWSQLATLAGIGIDGEAYTASPRKVQFTVEGFSEKINGDFLSELANEMNKLELSPAEFAQLREEMQDSAQVTLSEDAYERAVKVIRGLRDPNEVDIPAWLPELEKLSAADLNAYAKQLGARSSLEMAVIGNSTEAQAKRMFMQVVASFNLKPQAPAERKPYQQEINLPAGKSYGYAAQIATNNSAWMMLMQFGPTNPANVALTQLAGAYIGSSYYEEMRTHRSLGYVVSARDSLSTTSPWLQFLIQSEKSADELAKLSDDWLKEHIAKIPALSAEAYAALKRGVTENLESPVDSVEAETTTFFAAIDQHGENFGYRTAIAEAVKALSKEAFHAALSKALSEEGKRTVAAYLNAEGTAVNAMPGQTKIESIPEFHQTVPMAEKPSWK